VSATLVVGQGSLADIYPPERRGWATGLYFVPILIGPIIGPLIGGALSDALGWRSTFVLLSILSFVILVVVFFLVPETHQYFVKEKFQKANHNKRIIDAEPSNKPIFRKPWLPLTFLADLTILPYVIVSTTTFTGLFISLTLFSNQLGNAPYNYTATLIGVLFVPTGVMTLIGSLLGGWLSDKAGEKYTDGRCPERRLIPAMAFAYLTPVGLMIYGWAFHYKVYVAVPIIGQVVLGFGQAAQMPGVFAYLTAKKQKDAAAVSAANTLVYFCGAGIGVSVAVPLQTAMGTGPFFSLVAGINVVAIVVASILVYKQIRKSRLVDIQQGGLAPVSIKSGDTIVVPAN
jgi:MFS family permease